MSEPAQRQDNKAGLGRRDFLAAAGLGAPALIAGCARVSETARSPAPQIIQKEAEALSTPSDLVVETDKGKVRGYISRGVRTFKGIPYGADTSGKNRFRPPVAPAAWNGVRDALVYGPTCPQAPISAPGRMDFLMRPRHGFSSEDCLNLNIWTPETGAGSRPVMVWIHGGNYSTGSSIASSSYEGETLARRGDVVVVSVNHRLNILGHLDLQASGGSDEFSSSVNVGLLDLVRALEWIRDNISEFGGDPGNVLLFGQSGGGLKITHLSGMPLAKGLFHKAVVQSGSQVDVFDESMTAELAQTALAELSLTGSDIESLQDVPLEKLQAAGQAAAAAWRTSGGFGNIWRTVAWAPRIEAGTIPWHPFSAEGAAVSRNISLMAGSTLQEFSLSLFNPDATRMDREALKSAISGMYTDAETVVAVAEAAYPQQPPVALYSIISAASFNRTNAIRQCQAKAALGGAPAYLYQFAWETPVLDGLPRAYHGAELPFVFGNARQEIQATGGGSDAMEIENQVCGAWLGFARSAAPAHGGLPDWPEVTADTSSTMVFDTRPKLETDRDLQLVNTVAKLRK